MCQRRFVFSFLFFSLSIPFPILEKMVLVLRINNTSENGQRQDNEFTGKREETCKAVILQVNPVPRGVLFKGKLSLTDH